VLQVAQGVSRRQGLGGARRRGETTVDVAGMEAAHVLRREHPSECVRCENTVRPVSAPDGLDVAGLRDRTYFTCFPARRGGTVHLRRGLRALCPAPTEVRCQLLQRPCNDIEWHN
jgi:hypothetical protein